ncbi:hypothetical protein SETIT_1G127400v2 [Setaria italica]|uniref:Uncharacterized protein n=1 Tax=Setaria italica TaxID=4555 RepID=A0A368PK05_SETIT|nr:hypothetical protein SETIT_1G127400v2 [Setaria italica]
MLILPLALLPGTLASGGAGRGGAAPESQSSPASSTPNEGMAGWPIRALHFGAAGRRGHTQRQAPPPPPRPPSSSATRPENPNPLHHHISPPSLSIQTPPRPHHLTAGVPAAQPPHRIPSPRLPARRTGLLSAGQRNRLP